MKPRVLLGAGDLIAGPWDGVKATLAVALGVAGLVSVGTGVAAAAPGAGSCTANAGGSGLSARVVAHANQTIAHRTIDATACDIGIYVGAGATHVTIDSVKVSGAGFQGIFAEKTAHLSVTDSTIIQNGFRTIDSSAPALQGSGLHSFVGQSFAISLFGVSDSTVARNEVRGNGRGGIGVMDNGPNDPGALTQNHSAPLVSSTHDQIIGNRLRGNYNGCAIVLATQNLGGSLSHLRVADNTVTGTGRSRAHGPDTGGIVVAADPPNSSVSDVWVTGNKITRSFEGGVVVNAEAFNAWTKNVHVTRNVLSKNNWGHLEAPNTAGIIVFANPAAAGPPNTSPPENRRTVLARNTTTGQAYGIWSAGRNGIQVSGGPAER